MAGISPQRDPLQRLALLYLAIPNLIFFAGWLQPGLALLPVLATIYLLATSPFARDDINPASGQAQGILIIAGLAWATFSGGSHFFHADHDWVVRDALLGDLVRNHWPAVYGNADGELYILRSAIGFFLPAALWGKLFGLTHLAVFVYIWTALGCILFLHLIIGGGLPWTKRLAGLLVVIGFSGMDFPGLILATQSLPIFPLRLEWWVPLSYPSLTGHLLWAPNHCLPSLICAGLLLRHLHDSRLACLMLPALAFSLIWTPFTLIGMLPLTITALWHLGRSCLHWARPWLPVGASMLVAGMVGMFLLIDIHSLLSSPGTAQPDSIGSVARLIGWQDYALFTLMEFGILGLCLIKGSHRCRALLVTALAILLALPFLHLGPSNDLLIRASAPALVVLLYFSLQTLRLTGPHGEVENPIHRANAPLIRVVAVTLVIGMITPGFEFARALLRPFTPAHYDTAFLSTQNGRMTPHYLGRLPESTRHGIFAPTVPVYAP